MCNIYLFPRNNSIVTSTIANITRQHPSSYPPPLFSSPVATATSQSSSLPSAPPAHNPFSAESLFQSSKLRVEYCCHVYYFVF